MEDKLNKQTGGLQRTQQGSPTKMQTVRIASTHRLESLWRLVTPVGAQVDKEEGAVQSISLEMKE